MANTLDLDDYLSTAEVARRLGLSVSTVWTYVSNRANNKSPVLDGVRVGRTVMVHRTELERFIEERRRRGRPAKQG